MAMRRRQSGGRMGARCVGCGEVVRITEGKWTATFCRACAAASWRTIYDRGTAFGAIPENLLRRVGDEQTGARVRETHHRP